MSWYLHHIPSFIQKLYPQRLWHIPTDEKVLYLTFDDGPHPTLTPQILDLLSKFHAKVTFFHLGSKAEAYPILVDRCKSAGHTIGNHGHEHYNAWNTDPKIFKESVKNGSEINRSKLYRPAYGRLPIMGKSEILKERKVVMWDVMPGDFDDKMTAEQCCGVIKKYARPALIR